MVYSAFCGAFCSPARCALPLLCHSPAPPRAPVDPLQRAAPGAVGGQAAHGRVCPHDPAAAPAAAAAAGRQRRRAPAAAGARQLRALLASSRPLSERQLRSASSAPLLRPSCPVEILLLPASTIFWRMPSPLSPSCATFPPTRGLRLHPCQAPACILLPPHCPPGPCGACTPAPACTPAAAACRTGARVLCILFPAHPLARWRLQQRPACRPERAPTRPRPLLHHRPASTAGAPLVSHPPLPPHSWTLVWPRRSGRAAPPAAPLGVSPACAPSPALFCAAVVAACSSGSILCFRPLGRTTHLQPLGSATNNGTASRGYNKQARGLVRRQ